jgi:predicted small lipoprotein YifL
LIPGSDQWWVRLAAAGALVAMLGLTGCGRKGPLDPPPAAAVPVQGVQPGQPVDVLGPDGRPLPPGAPPPNRQPFILDWLVN